MIRLYISCMNGISLNREGGDMTCHKRYGIRESSRMLVKIKRRIITDLGYLLLRERLSGVSLVKGKISGVSLIKGKNRG